MNMIYDDALNVLNAAIKKAKELNLFATIAVVDTGGHLLALARLDSQYGVLDFAIKKARTAVMFGVDSDMMGNVINDTIAKLTNNHQMHGSGIINSNGGLLTIAGGVVIKDKNGNIIGAIGSSGGTYEQDKEVSVAGASVLS